MNPKKRGPKGIRLPFDPIESKVLHARAGQNGGQGTCSTPGPHNWYGLSLLARTSGIPRQTIVKWRKLGVPLSAADRAAQMAGADHPVDLWGGAYYDACELYERSLSDDHKRVIGMERAA